MVAVVGENGAGKSTLVKLLTKMYEPTAGTISVDGAAVAADAGRPPGEHGPAGAFQDFYRFEFLAQRSIGLGDLERADDESAVRSAVERAGAGDVVRRLPDGLREPARAHLARRVELSFGQWQKLALARGYMRDAPLLMVLDEPTAALDAETEHELFQRYADAARHSAAGGITVLVSHRFEHGTDGRPDRRAGRIEAGPGR